MHIVHRICGLTLRVNNLVLAIIGYCVAAGYFREKGFGVKPRRFLLAFDWRLARFRCHINALQSPTVTSLRTNRAGGNSLLKHATSCDILGSKSPPLLSCPLTQHYMSGGAQRIWLGKETAVLRGCTIGDGPHRQR